MRASPKTYYGYTGRFRDNLGKAKTSASKKNQLIKRKFSECSCTQMIAVVDGVFVTHNDIAGNYCNGSEFPSDFWKYNQS